MFRPIRSMLAATALALGLAGGAQAVPGGCPLEGATPLTIGPVNPISNFPLFVTDTTGLSVEFCSAVDFPGQCISTLPIPGNVFSEQIGFADEGFMASADTALVTSSGLDAIMVSAVELAFLTPEPIDGDQFPFTRLRIRIDIPFAGIYTVTHPWGQQVFTITTPGVRAINESFDITFAANTVQQGRIGPLLRWDTFDAATGTLPDAAPPANVGFIGDLATDHAVTGSPCNTNFFQISAVELDGVTPLAIDPADQDGDGSTSSVATNLFTVTGKLFTGVIPTPLSVDRSTYARNANGQVDVFATAPATATVVVNGGPNLPAGDTPLIGNGLGQFFAHIPVGDPSVLPATVNVTATNTVIGNGPTTVISPLVDEVNITTAEYDVTTSTLSIGATSSDLLAPPVLTAFGFADLPDANGGLLVAGTGAPPAMVTVTSSAGGSDTEFVTVVAVGVPGNLPPTAVADAATTDEDMAVTISVLANDTDTDGVAGIDPTTVTIGTAPANGTAVPDAVTGTVTYTPNLNFNGTDTFTYTVRDTAGALSNVALVTVTVNNVNDPPVANDDPGAGGVALQVAVNQFIDINVLANDTDPDGVLDINPASLTIVSQPAQGTANVVVSPATGQFLVRYTANTNTGTFTFTYTVEDLAGAVSNVATVTVTVVPGGGGEVLTIDRAVFRTGNNRWIVRGTSTATLAPNGGANQIVATLQRTGQVIGFDAVDITGAWIIRITGSSVVPVAGDVVQVISSNGATATRVVRIRN